MNKAGNWLTVLIVLSMILGVLYGQFVLHDTANLIEEAPYTLTDHPTVRYIPDSNYVGSDEFTFMVTDGELKSETATVSIQVGLAPTSNNADEKSLMIASSGHVAFPVAYNQSVYCDENSEIEITLAYTSAEGDDLSCVIKILPINGKLFDLGRPIDGSHWTKSVGDLVLIRPLKMLVIPLIFLSVVAGITRIGDPSKLGKLGASTLVYYFGTMLIAVVIGATLVTIIQPGHLDAEAAQALQHNGQVLFDANETKKAQIEGMQSESLGSTWLNILKQCIPTNIISEMANGRPLGIIVFALGFGLALAAGGQRTEAARRFFNAAFEGMMIFVKWVIWLTPFGVFFLMAWTVGTIGIGTILGPLGSYMGVVLLGLAIHGLIVLPLILWLLTGFRCQPYRFMWQMRRALLTAFGTDSSSATLPVTMDSAENEGGCSKRSSNFVLPLGSTINMDGTALYEAVAVVFLFQLFGFELGFSELVVVVITATLAAVGAAGIPSAGLVTMVIVIAAVNSSLQGTGQHLPLAAIGVILGVDRILDMCRTTVNVWGDATAAKVMTLVAPDEVDTELAE